MDEVEIAVCPSEQTGHALNLLFAGLPEEERVPTVDSIAAALRSDPVAGQGLWIAADRHGLRGTVLVQEQRGKTALLWPPSTRPANRPLERRLAQAADEHLQRRGVTMAQALLATREDPAIPALESTGFRLLTELEYMIAHVTPSARREAPLHGLQFEPFDASKRGRLAALLEATYEGTDDCPQLNGIRQTDEVLEGYQATGVFDPAKWFLVSYGGEDVGVLLLAEHAATRQWEVVYMGLIPQARGRGFGKEIVDFALRRAALDDIASTVLAVDANNMRAKNLYRRCGFHAWTRRIIYWKRYASD